MKAPETELLFHIANIARSRRLKCHEKLRRELGASKSSENSPERAPASCEGRLPGAMIRPCPSRLAFCTDAPPGFAPRFPYSNRFNRRELLTTLTLERAMAAPARAGARMPTAASGIMMQL